MNLISRKEAKSKGSKHYYTGKPCKHGHLSERYVSSKGCTVCLFSRIKGWRKMNPEKVKKSRRVWFAKHGAEWRRAWLKTRKDIHRSDITKALSRAAVSRWRNKNIEKARMLGRAWRKANPHFGAAQCCARHARQLQAVPLWFDKFSVNKIYAQSAWLSLASGIKYHVDHIIPLKHEVVCGLHCADNLQIITAVENIRKNNRFINIEG